MGNWDFDGDEFIFFIAAAILGLYGLYQWYGPLISATRLGRRGAARTLLGLTPPVAMVGLMVVLLHWSDPKYVVGHFDYQQLFAAGGLAWLTLALLAGSVLGVDVRDDAIDRDNPAAAVAGSGAAIGAMAIYAASNMGAGPTIWTTIWPAILATAAAFVLWFVIDLLTRIGDQIAVERDLAAGLRHAGWAIASGLVLGRAVAGDWLAWDSTYTDMLRLGWPVLVLAAAIVPLHLLFRPTPKHPRRSIIAAGVVPAVGLIGAALVYWIAVGPPEIGKHIITYEQYMGKGK
jgi:uncharacterized membrane protein YjfL (UPF0719 family)